MTAMRQENIDARLELIQSVIKTDTADTGWQNWKPGKCPVPSIGELSAGPSG